jgi:hypothetical protein
LDQHQLGYERKCEIKRWILLSPFLNLQSYLNNQDLWFFNRNTYTILHPFQLAWKFKDGYPMLDYSHILGTF